MVDQIKLGSMCMNPQMFEQLFANVYHYDWEGHAHAQLSSQTRALDWTLEVKKHPKTLQSCLVFPFPDDLSDEQVNIRSESNLFVRKKMRRRFKKFSPKTGKGRAKKNLQRNASSTNHFESTGDEGLHLPEKARLSPESERDLLDPQFVENLPSAFETQYLPLEVFHFDEPPTAVPTFTAHLSFRSRSPEDLFAVGLGNSLLLPKNAFSQKQKTKIETRIWRSFVNSDVTYNNRFTSWERDQLGSLKTGGLDFFRELVATLNRGLTLQPDRQLKSCEVKNSLVNVLPGQVVTARALLLEKGRVLELQSFNTLKALRKALRPGRELLALLDRCNWHANFRKFAVTLKTPAANESENAFALESSVNESTKQIRRNIQCNLQKRLHPLYHRGMHRNSEASLRSRRGPPSKTFYMPKVNGEEFYSFRKSDADVSGSLNGLGHFRHSMVSVDVNDLSQSDFRSRKPSIADMLSGMNSRAKGGSLCCDK